jgi:hypothetical protein
MVTYTISIHEQKKWRGLTSISWRWFNDLFQQSTYNISHELIVSYWLQFDCWILHSCTEQSECLYELRSFRKIHTQRQSARFDKRRFRIYDFLPLHPFALLWHWRLFGTSVGHHLGQIFCCAHSCDETAPMLKDFTAYITAHSMQASEYRRSSCGFWSRNHQSTVAEFLHRSWVLQLHQSIMWWSDVCFESKQLYPSCGFCFYYPIMNYTWSSASAVSETQPKSMFEMKFMLLWVWDAKVFGLIWSHPSKLCGEMGRFSVSLRFE